MIDPAHARAFVGLGGNLGDRLATLRAAVQALARPGLAHVIATSAVYETRPLGPSTEPFLNAAVELRTALPPEPLLEAMLAIEAQHGRQRRRRWDARTLDLDLLVYERPTPDGWHPVTAPGPGLVLPHPAITARDFVLAPLRDLMGGDAPLGPRTLDAWLAHLDDADRTLLRRVLEPGQLHLHATVGEEA